MIITIIFFRQMAHILFYHFSVKSSFILTSNSVPFFGAKNGSIFNDTHKSIDRCRLKKVSLILTFINFFPRMKIFLFKKLNNTSFFCAWNWCDNTGFNPNSLMAAWFFKHHNELKLVKKSFHFFGKTIQCLFQTGKKKNQLLGQNHLIIDFVKTRYNLIG